MIDGVLVIDKPTGMTSHDVVARVRKAAGQRKVGHTGTLDPDATGVLVCALGRATRLVDYLQASAKTYDATMALGATTDTLDAAGAVQTTTDASSIDEVAVCEALKAFVGPIAQIPPMVSAVKIGGERLHAKARRGEVVDRPPRDVVIHDLVLESFTPGERAEASFLVRCSPGTYVRTLAADIGERLGVGGHLTALRRLASGVFTTARAHTLDAIAEAGQAGRLQELMLSMAEAMTDHPVVHAAPDVVADLSHGRPIPATGHTGPVAIVDGDRLIAVVADRGDVAKPLVVVAPAGGGA